MPFATTLRKDLPRLITAPIKEGQCDALAFFFRSFRPPPLFLEVRHLKLSNQVRHVD